MIPENKEELINLSVKAWLNVKKISLSDAFNMLMWMMEEEGIDVPYISESEILELETNISYLPMKLEIYIGGVSSKTFTLELIDKKLFYSQSDGGYIGEKKSLPIPDDQQWNNFRATLDKVNIWGWQDTYDSDILDGLQWEIKIIFDSTKKIISYGSNSYPEQFQSFITAVRQLTGGLAFGEQALKYE